MLSVNTPSTSPRTPERSKTEAIDGLGNQDAEQYATAVEAIVAFADREEHLTGVAIADTALVGAAGPPAGADAPAAAIPPGWP